MSSRKLDTFRLNDSEAFKLGDSLDSVVEKLEKTGLDVSVENIGETNIVTRLKEIEAYKDKEITMVSIDEYEYALYFVNSEFIGIVNVNVFPFYDNTIGITLVTSEGTDWELNLTEFTEMFTNEYSTLSEVLEKSDLDEEAKEHIGFSPDYGFYTSIIKSGNSKYIVQTTESFTDSDIITIIKDDYKELGDILIDGLNVSKYLEFREIDD